MMQTPNTSTRNAVLGLGGLAAVVVITVLLVDIATEERITTVRAALRDQQLLEVLPHIDFDPPLSGDIVHQDQNLLLGVAPLPVHRFWQSGAPAAAVLQVTAPDGYNGDIVMLVGVRVDGDITGVRVVSHRETPGLGDDIERRRSDWITGFDGLALGSPPDADWSVVQHGGRFDAFTGATITPQAVVQAVHQALLWFEAHSGLLFSIPRESP